MRLTNTPAKHPGGVQLTSYATTSSLKQQVSGDERQEKAQGQNATNEKLPQRAQKK